MTAYSVEDLRSTGANEYRQIGTGIYFSNRNGRRVEKTVGVEYVPTKLGKIERTKWFRMMEEAVKRENQKELLEQIEKACRRLAWLKTEKDRHEYALEVLSSKAYLHWPEWSSGFCFHFQLSEENDDIRRTEAD